jgi:acyl carrier protein
MPRLSRWMPPSPKQPMGRAGYVILGVSLAGLCAVLAFSSVGRVIVGGIIVLIAVHHVFDQRRLRRLALARLGEDVCSFARSFDRRATDFWVVRAIHDELRPYVRFRSGQLPIRASDTLDRDLRIDSEDLVDIARDACLRTGRAFENLEANPHYDRVTTVADLVAFVQHQPKASQPAA